MKINSITRGLILVFVLTFPAASQLRADDAPKQLSNEKLIARTYVLSATFFPNDPMFTSANDRQVFDVMKLLVAKGIKFPLGTSAKYTPSTRQLDIVNYPDQIKRFEELPDR